MTKSFLATPVLGKGNMIISPQASRKWSSENDDFQAFLTSVLCK